MNNIHPKDCLSPSYSRTCPVVLSHPSTRESLVGLAIIDDQAAMTFVDPLIRTALKLPPEVMKAVMQGGPLMSNSAVMGSVKELVLLWYGG